MICAYKRETDSLFAQWYEDDDDEDHVEGRMKRSECVHVPVAKAE